MFNFSAGQNYGFCFGNLSAPMEFIYIYKHLKMNVMVKKILFCVGLFCSFLGHCQLFEGFETTLPPNAANGVWQLNSGAWHVSTNSSGPTLNWNVQPQQYPAYEGTHAAFSDRRNIGAGNTSQDWLVTPLINLGNNPLLSFFSRTTLFGNNEALFKIMVSTTSQTDHAAFTTIKVYSESELAPVFNQYEQKFIPLQNYIGQHVYIAFVRENTQPANIVIGDRWLLDNVSVEQNVYNVISGTVSLADTQADCNTSLATPLDNVQIVATTEMGSGVRYTHNGNYHFPVVGYNVTILPNVNPAYFDVTPGSANLTLTESQNQDIGAHFCVVPTIEAHHDVETQIFPVDNARPGFDSSYRVVVKNNGNRIESGTVGLTFNGSVMDYVSAHPAIASQTGNSVNWIFSGLQLFEERTFVVTLNVNSAMEMPPVNIDDVLILETNTLPTDADENLADNSASLNQIVIGALDPNDKVVNEGKTISPEQLSDYLHYTIRFQNLGTAPATFIRVVDEIESDLDIQTLVVQSASHPFVTEVRGDRIEFLFDNANLPAASADESGSHGYVAFKIKPKVGVGIGEIITNNAEIFFDFNAPIVTNTTETTVNLLQTTDFNFAGVFALYPNPASNAIAIRANKNTNIQSISICTALGQVVKNISHAMVNGEFLVDISHLSAATYFVQVISDKGKTTKKLIKL